MQKKLITLAIAGALAIPGAAMADVKTEAVKEKAKPSDVTVYGKFHASWDYVDNNATGDDSDDNTAVFRNSRLGFKGSEDLGSGLKGIWQIETKIDTGDDEVSLRNTFVGLQGDSWGTVLFGKHDTPYKTATAKLDIFSDTIADYNNIIGTHLYDDQAGDPNVKKTFDARPPQVVAYETPNFSGFKAQLARLSFQNDEASGAEDSEAWSTMGMYDQGPFFASLAYEVQSGVVASGVSQGATAGKEKFDAWKVGLGYRLGKTTELGFVYEDIEHDDSANLAERSRDAFWVGASHKFGANVLKVAYGKADDSDANADDGADNWSIGVDHEFSPRTKVYAIYTDMSNDASANYTLNAGGLSDYNPADGKDVSAFSLGIVHNF